MQGRDETFEVRRDGLGLPVTDARSTLAMAARQTWAPDSPQTSTTGSSSSQTSYNPPCSRRATSYR